VHAASTALHFSMRLSEDQRAANIAELMADGGVDIFSTE
jgi:hypothetical protein